MVFGMPPLDEIQRRALQREFDEALKGRAELDAVLKYLGSRLGIEVPSGADEPKAAAAPLTGNPVDAVNPGQFFGMSATKATRSLLEKVGRDRPLKTAEIYQAITKGGVVLKDREVLAKSLKRDKRFHRVGRGLWGLAAWYPASVLDRAAQDGELHDLDDDLDEVNGSPNDSSDASGGDGD
jgi:hypothetical protein